VRAFALSLCVYYDLYALNRIGSTGEATQRQPPARGQRRLQQEGLRVGRRFEAGQTELREEPVEHRLGTGDDVIFLGGGISNNLKNTQLV